MVSNSKSIGRDGMVAIPAGHYQVGSDRFYPEEAPVRQVSIASFEIDQALSPMPSFNNLLMPPAIKQFPSVPWIQRSTRIFRLKSRFLSLLFSCRHPQRWIAVNPCPGGP